jgi:hypothetical protein
MLCGSQTKQRKRDGPSEGQDKTRATASLDEGVFTKKCQVLVTTGQVCVFAKALILLYT